MWQIYLFIFFFGGGEERREEGKEEAIRPKTNRYRGQCLATASSAWLLPYLVILNRTVTLKNTWFCLLVVFFSYRMTICTVCMEHFKVS